MRLTIENIGLIRHAQIQLNGLTVIAGSNDSGKSTVGKIIFSLVKAIQRYQDDLEESKDIKLAEKLRTLFVEVRQEVDFVEHENLFKAFNPRFFQRDVQRLGLEAFKKRQQVLLDYPQLAFVKEQLAKIQQFWETDVDQKEAIQRAFNKVLFSEFMGDVRRKHIRNEDRAEIRLEGGVNCLVKAEIKPVNSVSIDVFDEVIYQDATWIETPYVLNIIEALRFAKARFDDLSATQRLPVLLRPNIALHIQDLVEKLQDGGTLVDDLMLGGFDQDVNLGSPFLSKIFRALEGEFSYNRQSRGFLFAREGEQYKMLNLASGIKSFGVLQLLEVGGFLKPQNIIVIDEPEVHLHPKWQLLYAELIIDLVNRGTHVLVTTHSPYMLEALELYATKYLQPDQARYYQAEVNNGTVITDVTDHLDAIYQSLAEPFDDLERLNFSLLGEQGDAANP